METITTIQAHTFIVTYEVIYAQKRAEITLQKKQAKYINNKKSMKNVRKERKNGSNEETYFLKPEEKTATTDRMEATDVVNGNKSSSNKNGTTNIPRRASQEDQSSSKTQSKTRRTIICGDSMFKNIMSWEMKCSCRTW